MTLPAYDVVIWLRSPSTPTDLLGLILERAKLPPCESTESSGFRDIHWGFSNATDAMEFAEGLLEFAALEDVVKLTAIGETIGRKVYKDTVTNRP